MKSSDLIQEQETAIIIFTDGRGFKFNENGSGISGVWRINKNIAVDKVIVYLRKAQNEVYCGDFVQLLPSNEKELPNRSVVEFINLKFVGFTNLNWNEFTNTKRGSVSPIKYIR